MTGTGTIHVQAEKGIAHEKMKKLLIKTAKGAGQSCAYIVRGIAGSALVVYRVDLKDGKETQCPYHGFPHAGVDKIVEVGCHILEGGGDELLAERLSSLDDLSCGDDRGRHGDREG